MPGPCGRREEEREAKVEQEGGEEERGGGGGEGVVVVVSAASVVMLSMWPWRLSWWRVVRRRVVVSVDVEVGVVIGAATAWCLQDW